MLNTSLTTQIGVAGAHAKIWEPFMKYLLDILSVDTGIVYVLMGKTAQSWRSYIDEDLNFIFTCTHPAHAAYTQGDWYSNGVFKHTTDTIKKYHNYDIQW
jgi:uracil DNA glycosylase